MQALEELHRWKLLTGSDSPEEANKIIVELEEEAFRLRQKLSQLEKLKDIFVSMCK